jgi:hypothetical protein
MQISKQDIYTYIYAWGKGVMVFERKNIYQDNADRNDVSTLPKILSKLEYCIEIYRNLPS